MESKGIVLIVDDEPVIRLLLTGFLSPQGWDCCVAGGRSEAERLLGERAVTHAIVDLHLGPDSGYDLIRAIRSRWPGVRVIAMTGSVIGAPDAALAAGAARVLTKPFSPLDVVSAALGGSAAGEAAT